MADSDAGEEIDGDAVLEEHLKSITEDLSRISICEMDGEPGVAEVLMEMLRVGLDDEPDKISATLEGKNKLICVCCVPHLLFG